MPEIELIVAGKVDGATQGLQKVEKELANAAIAANKTSDSLENIDRALIPLQNNLRKFEAALKRATDPGEVAYLQRSVEHLKGSIQKLENLRPLKGFNTSVNQAGAAMTDFSRIIQDAPFGFIGITNNINPMLESFQRLKASTGTTGGALKAMAASLAGPAGLGLAVSVVSSLLVVFGDRLFKTSKEVDKAKEAFDGLVEGIAKESLQLRENFAAITDANIPLANRKKIIEDLRNSYGAYLKNVSDEALLTGQAAEAYNLINNALLKKLQLQAAEEKILPLIKQQVDLQFQLNQAQAKGLELRKFIDATTGAGQAKIQKDNAVAIAASNENLGEQLSLQRQIARVGEQINNLFRNLTPLLQFDDASIRGIKPEKIKEKLDKDWKTGFNLWIRSLVIDLNEFQAKIPLPVEFVPVVTNDFTKEAIERAIAKAGITQFNQRFGFKVPINFQAANTDELKAIFADMEARVKNFEKNVSDIFNTLQTELAVGFAEGIGKALAGEDIGSLFGGLFAIIGKAISELGKQMILISPLLKAIKVSLSSLNPVLAAAAGFALVALGAYIQSKAPKLASGGIIPPGYPNDSFPAFLQSNEAVIPLDRINDYLRPAGGEMNVRVTGELRGQTIYLQQQRTARSNNRNF